MVTISGLLLERWVLDGNICEQCKGYDGCPKFNCKLIEKAKQLTDKQWARLAKKYVVISITQDGVYVPDIDDRANLFKDLQKIKVTLKKEK